MAGELKAGVVGAGVFGGYHANKYLETEGVRLVGIYDQDGPRATAAAEERGVSAFTDFAAFLEAVDVLTVATPATTHYRFAEEALLAGRHVLVEKPIALDIGDADRLIEIAAKGGLVLQVGHQERYVADAFGLFDRGVPKRVTSRRLNRFSGRAMDVSIVFDLMIHDLDLLAILTGTGEGTVEDVTARFSHGETADFVDVTLRLGGDLEARLTASRMETDPVRDLHIVYPDGEVTLDFLTRHVNNTTKIPLGVDVNSADQPLGYRDPLAFGTRTFIDNVRNGGEPTVGGPSGRRALGLALKIEAAANAMKEQMV